MAETEEKEPQVRFLCNCMIERSDFEVIGIVQDDELFVLCPTHKVRRFGWRSPLYDQYKAFPFDQAKPHYVTRPNHGRSDQENEREFWNRLGIDILKTAIQTTMAEKVALDEQYGSSVPALDAHGRALA